MVQVVHVRSVAGRTQIEVFTLITSEKDPGQIGLMAAIAHYVHVADA